MNALCVIVQDTMSYNVATTSFSNLVFSSYSLLCTRAFAGPGPFFDIVRQSSEGVTRLRTSYVSEITKAQLYNAVLQSGFEYPPLIFI